MSGFTRICDTENGRLTSFKRRFGSKKEFCMKLFNNDEIRVFISDVKDAWTNCKFDPKKSKTLSLRCWELIGLENIIKDAKPLRNKVIDSLDKPATSEKKTNSTFMYASPKENKVYKGSSSSPIAPRPYLVPKLPVYYTKNGLRTCSTQLASHTSTYPVSTYPVSTSFHARYNAGTSVTSSTSTSSDTGAYLDAMPYSTSHPIPSYSTSHPVPSYPTSHPIPSHSTSHLVPSYPTTRPIPCTNDTSTYSDSTYPSFDSHCIAGSTPTTSSTSPDTGAYFETYTATLLEPQPGNATTFPDPTSWSSSCHVQCTDVTTTHPVTSSSSSLANATASSHTEAKCFLADLIDIDRDTASFIFQPPGSDTTNSDNTTVNPENTTYELDVNPDNIPTWNEELFQYMSND